MMGIKAGSKAAVRIIFGVICCIIIVYLAGGTSFLTRPVGAIYISLVLAWMVTIAIWRGSGVSSKYERSQKAIYILLGVIYMATLFAAPWEYAHYSGPIPRDGPLAFVGLAVFASGIAIRQWALMALHGLYTARLGIQPGHSLITSGPYGLVRHPGYLGELMSVLGIGLALSSIIGLAMAALLLMALIRRMNVEEAMLAEQFGQAFQEYAKKTKRLIPLIY